MNLQKLKKPKFIPPKMSNFSLFLWAISLFIAVLIAGGITYIQYQIHHPLSRKEKFQIFPVLAGETIKEISQNLEARRLIRDDFYFRLYLKKLQQTKKQPLTFKAGEYRLSPHLSIPQIAKILIEGRGVSNEIKITVPEGYNIFQIARLLRDKGLVKKEEEFLKIVRCPKTPTNNTHLSKNQRMTNEGMPLYGIGEISADSCLEGYLFPDTYYFKKGDGVEKIVRKMLTNFEQKILSLVQINKKTDLQSLITLASLLEKEVSSYYDRQVVAGILYKRLKAEIPLQVDATLLYAKRLNLERPEQQRDQKRDHNPVSIEDTKIASPYNTYKYKGLPPGPICNPGLEAIKAALRPVNTAYWYYLSTRDGRTIYSKTYKQHLEAKQRFLRKT